MAITREFVVALLFDEKLEHILLVKRARRPFPDCHNGPGGEVEPGEAPYAAALREIREETGLPEEDLIPFSGGSRLCWVGTLSLPYNRKYSGVKGSIYDPPATLYYFAGRMSGSAKARTVEERNQVRIFKAVDIIEETDGCPKLAGNGNLEYFVREAVIQITNDMAAQAGIEP